VAQHPLRLRPRSAVESGRREAGVRPSSFRVGATLDDDISIVAAQHSTVPQPRFITASAPTSIGIFEVFARRRVGDEEDNPWITR